MTRVYTTILSLALTLILAAAPVFANGGIIIADANDQPTTCTETTEVDSGIIIADIIGIIIADFTGIIIADATETTNCGIIIAD